VNLALSMVFLHRLVCLHIVRAWVMQKHDVDVVYVELTKSHFNGWLRIGELFARIKFCDDGDFLALADSVGNSLTHSTSHLFLVAIHVGSIDESVAILDGGVNRIETNIAMKRVSADAECWQSHSVVEHNRWS